MPVRLKRAYDAPAGDDGYRVLVDRLWPRGISKQDLKIDGWLKDIAPSDELRRWFNHDPGKWGEFKQRYFRELDSHSETLDELVKKASQGKVTLVFSAKDAEFNNAAALKEYLDRR